MSDGRGAHRGEQGVVLVKVDPDLEGGGEAASGGVRRGRGGSSPEVATHAGHPGNGGRGGGSGLERGDLQIVSIGHLVSLNCVEGGHSSALGPDIGFLRGVIRRGSDTIRGRDGGGGDDRTVAD